MTARQELDLAEAGLSGGEDEEIDSMPNEEGAPEGVQLH